MGYNAPWTGIGILLVLTWLAVGIEHVSGTIVSSDSGHIEGVVVSFKQGDVHQFKKIPYARPPVGPLRFSKPARQPPWNYTLDATQYGPACIQTFFGAGFSLPLSEDCLFLNVFVPNEISTTANKSVMVWIHGGGYTTGTGMYYDGSSLSLHGDVIVVTLNYRLGVFGFFSTGDSSAKGNYGLWDQIEALKWIKSNIKYFGGNPDSITLFGESAGAFSVSHLAMFPGNKGLFHRVIMQSGSVGSYNSIVEDPMTSARALGNYLGCSDIHITEALVACLREADASVLNTASDISYSNLLQVKHFGLALSYAPVIDGEMIPSHPMSLLQNQSSEQFQFYQSLDVISGCNSAEGTLAMLFIPIFPSLSLPAVNISEGIPSWAFKLFADALTELYYKNEIKILQTIYDKYTSSDIEEQGRLLVNLVSDSLYYMPMLESLLIHDRGGNSETNTFQYFFSLTSPFDVLIGVPPPWFVGAGHGAELPYLFSEEGDLEGGDKYLSTQMLSYWTNFAKYGNPNTGLEVPSWPEFDETTRRYIDLDTDITTGSDLLGDRMEFWTDTIPRIMSETELIIDTPSGPIKGLTQQVKGEAIHLFRKIPFAESPTGPLRFAKPVSISKWTDILDATRFGPSCVQTLFPGTKMGFLNKNISEDCLLLNIYVPNELKITANKSVMVWIHGGGYISGTGMTYDGTSLALQGDVIVVTLNYRLGVFGFFSTGDSSARGNYALWDQIEALKWIKSNIKYFGGNPDSITLFGGSAGAFSVSHLALFPENRGLFHRVIMQSGTFGSITKDPITNARALGSHLQCNNIHNSTSLVACLRDIDVAVLQTGSDSVFSFSSRSIFDEFALSPVIDGELISGHPMSILQNQSSEQFAFYQSLDVINGCNSAEGSMLMIILIPMFPMLSLPAVNVSEGIPSWVLKMFAQSLTEAYYNNDTRILQPIYDKYTSSDNEEQGRLLVNIFGDIKFYVPMLESLLLHKREGNTKSNTFQYFFSNQPEIDPVIGVPPKWFQGAGHAAEINYLFDNRGYLKGGDRVLSTQMMAYWTNFANYGNPNTGLEVPSWPEFDETTRRYIDLDTDITTGSDLLGDRMEFWTDTIPRIMSETELIIDTPSGPIKGLTQQVKGEAIHLFRKIPFAESPTGPLRFAKPVSISKWTDILDATRFGPSCVQTLFPGTKMGFLNKNISEDCLLLNIYVPNELKITANKSVMVWIHGGGYTSGTGMTYDGTSLALQGDVIVVTLNYRLGVFGFFSTGDSSARGNYALWDQIEALKWIKSNIKYFGGNPDSITLFGGSAGAFSVSHLALFPENRGLFHRVIMQSGTFGSITKDPITNARALGSHLQCNNIHNSTSLVACLRDIDVAVLQTGSDSVFSFSSRSIFDEFALSPVIDGELISGHPMSILQNQSSEQFAFYQSLDVINGCNSAEGSMLMIIIPMFPMLSLPAVNVSEGIPSWVLKLFAQSLTEAYYNNDTRILQPIYDKYTSSDNEEQGRLLVNIFGDIKFYVPMLESLLLHKREGNTKSNTFQYFFSNQPEIDPVIGVPPKWFQGAGHAAEINYLFDNWGYLKGGDRVLSTQMMAYWTNFANYGNPNTGLEVPSWPEFDETTRRYIDLDTDISTGSDLLGDRMEFWTDTIPRIMSETELIIDTPSGPIKGLTQQVKGEAIHLFRKIPFAEPPTGPLRFAKPVSVSKWTDTLDATQFGPSCIQTMNSFSEKFLPNTNISEDCLFLNMYVPNEITANKSVMVWIHGGGYESGTGMTYDGTSLALHGDVIVVTLNYRLGVFGFFSTGDSSARGNYGLWDQIEALKWIKSNIKYFGGNPDSITLFGESAGALSISHLALIPENKGLFQRVIMQSGSLSSFGSITKEPLMNARSLGSYLKCNDIHDTSSLVSCLRGIDTPVLQNGADIVYSFSNLATSYGITLSYSPVIDGELISDHPLSLIQNQSSEQFAFYQSLDVISGCNSAEGSVFLLVMSIFPMISLPAVNISEGIPSWVLNLFAERLTEAYYNNDTRILQPIHDKYTSTDIEELGRLFSNLLGDIIFYVPMLESLLVHDKGGNTKANTFQYFFSNQPEIDPVIGVPPKWVQGAGHAAEIKYLFDNRGYLKGDNRVLSTQMMAYWTNFAKYGNPNTGLEVPSWPEFDETTRRYIDLDTDITTGSDLLGERMEFWTDKIPRIVSETELTITTPSGPIKGLTQQVKGEAIHLFRKIPFAEPPTGPLRFAKPVSISKWTDILDATRFGPSCIQTIYPESEMFLPNTNITEDCLFLNIYVPNEMTANKSVMVWVHGGGYESGTGMTYDGTSLALQGDVIVVTLNYRLGVFGFFSTGDSSARGNYGLWDQIEALKWIKSNIKYFGGNPDSITLFGESAGAFSVSHLALIPENRGLFHRVIMQSGPLSSFGSITKEPLTYARALGSQLHCSDIQDTALLVSCLRNIDSSVLQSVSGTVYSGISSLAGVFNFSISPVIDEELIPGDPLSLLQNQSSEQFAFYQSLDVISGCNSAEGTVFMMLFQMFPMLSLPAVNVSEGIPSWVLKLFAQSLTEAYYNNDTRILQPIYDKYTSSDNEEQGRLLVNFFGDITFYVPMLESLLLHKREGNTKSNTFQYFFSNQPEIDPVIGVPPKWFQGAGHAADLNYLFDNWGYLKGDDRVLSTQMMSYWTNFANYGNPNTGLEVPSWPEFDETTRRYIDLDTDISTGSDLLGDRMEFWTDKIPRIMSETELIIDTHSGPIKGLTQQVKGEAIHLFRKIPFAEPPTGPLRFAKPVSISKWIDILDATRFGPSCIQTMYPELEMLLPNTNISEDCLFLNIYVPNEMKANKSVMVWIHGGGYESGTGMTYDGTSLALQGDVIVVTLNYRLGVFGFFSTGDSSARGNYGLWDQIEALKWIKSNIKYFGGNPDSITLFGESAGALSISHLALIPENKGLFQRVIMQSGSLSSFGSITKEPLMNARSLGSYLKCNDIHDTSLLVSCLRGIDTPVLQNGADIVYALSNLATSYGITLSYSPVIDGELISDHPLSLIQNQSSEQFAFYQSLDVISGCNSAEGISFIMLIHMFPMLSLPAVNVSEGIPSWVLKLFAQSLTEAYYNNDTRILQPIYDKYTSSDNEEQGRLLVNLFGDITFYVPMLESLLVHNKGGNTNANTFQYFFSNQPEIDPVIGVPPKWVQGADHAADLNYLFDNWGYLKGDDRVLSTQMMSYWTNFAKYGNPNTGLEVPSWPEFDETTRRYIDLDTDITTGSDLLGERMEFWTDKIPRIVSETELTITTPSGPIKGLTQQVKGEAIHLFRKIPFAEPPTGPLRFAKPVSISKWTDILDATRFGPSCIQTIYPESEMFLPNTNITEDCLFLNIYVPNEMTANKSVMVWVHGGGYESGTGMTYDGTSLALQGDVIVVTLNYRLGVFGFFSTGDSSARGNYGLWDQIEALKWIKSNIKYFGGNPDSITLFGESAGAFSVSHLALIPENRGLFHRVIMQSGPLSSFGSITKEPLTYARALGSQLHCSDIQDTALLVSCLRNIDSSVLQSVSGTVYSGISSLAGVFNFSISPVIDGELIPGDPLSLLQNQSSEQFAFYQSLDVISGCNSAEGTVFMMLFQMFPMLSLPAVNVSEGIPSWVLKLFAQSLTEAYYNNDTRILQPIYDKYTSSDNEEQGRLLVNFFGDITFYVPMLESLLLHKREGNTKSNTFQYFFSNQPEIDPVIGVPPKWFQGAGHAADLNYLFDNWGYLKGDDRVLSTQMMSYWTNFANYGNPNTGLEVPSWPEFDETTRRYIDLDTDISTGSDLLGDRMEFWTNKIPRIMSETELIIDTPSGPIKGLTQLVKGEAIHLFRKIPFAEPPTGPLRFAKPVSISKWIDILDATRFGPSCIQTMYPELEMFLPNTNISEDCLFLNIYVPNEMTANKSVMVWIHGGGYTSETGMIYDGTSLALQGDVIVVTLNYRLGVFGFFSTGDSSARGNYGLWDQIEALKWIKSNIKYFGGNPDSITLFGESAGSFSVSHLALILESRGLFHRVIMQSGSLSSFGSITKEPLTYARALGSQLQCSDIQGTALLVSCLRNIDSSVLQSSSDTVYSEVSSLAGVFNFSISPVIDGELIPGDPLSLLQNQSSEQFAFYQSLDIISGCNSAEGSVFMMLIHMFPMLSLPAVNVSEGIPSWVLKLFAQSLTEAYYNNDTRILQPIYDKYTSTDIEEQGRLLVNFFGDVLFYVPMLESLLLHKREGNTNSKTFQYFFSNQPEIDPVIGVPPKWFQGAGHFAEINYLFDNWGYLKGDDQVLSTQMAAYWTNFANYGNPNTGLEVPYWPPFDETTRQFIDLDANITEGSHLLGDRMRFWTVDIPRILSDTDSIVTTPKPRDELSSASRLFASYIIICMCVILSAYANF